MCPCCSAFPNSIACNIQTLLTWSKDLAMNSIRWLCHARLDDADCWPLIWCLATLTYGRCMHACFAQEKCEDIAMFCMPLKTLSVWIERLGSSSSLCSSESVFAISKRPKHFTSWSIPSSPNPLMFFVHVPRGRPLASSLGHITMTTVHKTEPTNSSMISLCTISYVFWQYMITYADDFFKTHEHPYASSLVKNQNDFMERRRTRRRRWQIQVDRRK